MEKQNVVISTTTGAADCTVNNGFIKIKGCPDIKFINDLSVGDGWLYSLVETVDTALFTLTTGATATPNTEYSFTVQQWDTVNKKYFTRSVRYKSDSVGTSTDIIAGLVDGLNALTTANQCHLTAASASSSTFTVVGVAGYPKFNAKGGVLVTCTFGYTAVALHATGTTAVFATVFTPHGTAATALAASSGTVTITTLAAHGLVAGQTVTVTGATGFTFTRGGISSVGTIVNATIASVTSTTIVLDSGIVGVGTNTGTIVITDGTVTLTTAAAHTVTAGQSVNIAGATATTFYKNGVSYSAAIKNVRVHAVTSTTLILDPSISMTGTNTGAAATITVLGQMARGDSADLTAHLVASTDIASGSTYSSVYIQFYQKMNDTNMNRQLQHSSINLYIKEGITNFAGFKTALMNNLANLASGNTVGNPEAIASI